MNKEFLFELYSGEIPAHMQKNAALALQEAVAKKLRNIEIEQISSRVYFSPRRLCLLVEELEPFTKEIRQELRGPKVSANIAAVEAFAKANGVQPAELTQIDYKGELHYFFTKTKAAENIENILSVALEEVLLEFHWPKSMKWDDTGVRWVRPLLNILAVYNGRVVPVKFGNLSANNKTYGNFFDGKEQLEIENFQDYSDKLSKNRVMYDQDLRRSEIVNKAQKLADGSNLRIIEDEKLIDEVTGLVEYPNPVLGTIEPKFLTLPGEVLRCTIRSHQRYLCLLDGNGNFADKFIVVANSPPKNDALVIKGNERVLTARLNDAIFYYKEDQRRTLKERKEDLAKITFHKNLGTVADKIERVKEIAIFLADKIGYRDLDKLRAVCDIMKADLTTELVREFPELQGTVGYYYAIDQNYDKDIASAIKEHYQPDGRSDVCPESALAVIIALADKFDSMIGLFAAGEKPTGSKDSFGLRRLTLGIIRILLEKQINLDLKEVIELVLKLLQGKLTIASINLLQEELLGFFTERFSNFLKGEFDIQVLDTLSSVQDVSRAKCKLDEIKQAFSTRQGQEGINELKRVLRFTVNANSAEINPELFMDEIEKTFYSFIQEKKFDDLDSLLALADLINQYFDQVTINHEDEKIKTNRHSFISHLQHLINRYGIRL